VFLTGSGSVVSADAHAGLEHGRAPRCSHLLVALAMVYATVGDTRVSGAMGGMGLLLMGMVVASNVLVEGPFSGASGNLVFFFGLVRRHDGKSMGRWRR